MKKKKKKKSNVPRHKRLNRVARLAVAKDWIKKYEGKRIVRSYSKYFGVDHLCAVAELEKLGLTFDPDYVRQLRLNAESRGKARAERRARRKAAAAAYWDVWDEIWPDGITEDVTTVNDHSPEDARKFVIDRLREKRDIIERLEVDIAEAVDRVLDADAAFYELMDNSEEPFFSGEDQLRFIEQETGYDRELVEMILWQQHCHQMELGRCEFPFDVCLRCGEGPLHCKEVLGEDFEKVVCQNCGFEMMYDENGLEEFRADNRPTNHGQP